MKPTSLIKAALICLAVLSFATRAQSQQGKQSFFQLKIYTLKTPQQEERLDNFLKSAYLPALHKSGITNVGVFKPIEKDTSGQKVYVFIPFKSLDQFLKLEPALGQDKQFLAAGKDYIEAAHDNAPYNRIESILLKAFSGMPNAAKPNLTGPKASRVYELRSYEGPTEAIFTNKVQMFNKGDEVGIFKRLGFNAIFYGEVISGSKMPNLMYMTSFENKAERDKHWEAFGSDPAWKKLSAMPEYQNNVSKINIYFLYPTEYSGL